MQHRNARLTPTGRLELVRLVVEQGKTFEQAAACSNVRSKSTVSTWVRRWREASAEERATLRCLEDRSSRPHTSADQVPDDEAELICERRRRTGWSPRRIADEPDIRNAGYNLLRKAAREPLFEDACRQERDGGGGGQPVPLEEIAEAPVDVELASEAREALRTLAGLRWRRKRVLALKAAGYRYEEIAELLGVTYTNVNRHMTRDGRSCGSCATRPNRPRLRREESQSQGLKPTKLLGSRQPRLRLRPALLTIQAAHESVVRRIPRNWRTARLF